MRHLIENLLPVHLLPPPHYHLRRSHVFRRLQVAAEVKINMILDTINQRFTKSYPWAFGSGRDLSNAYVLPKRKKQFRSSRPIVSFFTSPFRPMQNCIAKLIYQLLPQAFPHNLARGDVYDLIQLLKNHNRDQQPALQIYNQDLAGFFRSIDTERFIDSWRLTLHYHNDSHPDELFSVKPSIGNTSGDVVKGRTCRTHNVTRKIYIRDVEPIILMSLQMTTFSIGSAVFEQIRGSPMGSNLSPPLCLMVVALAEEIWYRSFRGTLATLDLSSRLLRYVDNRLCLVDSQWQLLLPSSIRSFTANPSSWKQNRTRSSWSFASSLILLLSNTAHRATSTKSWLRTPLHLSLYS